MILPALVLAAACFGLNFDPAATNVATESRIYPISPVAYRLIQPDGQSRVFELTDAEKGILSGPKPWLGVVKDTRIDIWADPAHTGGKLRTAYTFIAGRLRLMVLDGVKYTFPHGSASPRPGDLEKLFPARKKRSYDKNSAADIWRRDGGRMRLWFASPNSAGAFLALLVLSLTLVFRRTRRFVRLGVTVLLLACSYCLLATGSRGALVGLAIGLSIQALPHARRLFTKRGLMIACAGLLVVCAGLTISGNAERMVQSFHKIDRGNQTRLKGGKAAVQMFADAPFGWQGGEVPGRNACLNWYVFDESHSLRTHVMSLAECGWFKGYVYLFLWALVLAVGAISMKRGGEPVVSLWAAFFVTGFFNPVYIDWEVWLLPLVSLGLLLPPFGRMSAKDWLRSCMIAAVASAGAVVGLVALGKSLDRPVKVSVRPCGRATLVNGDSPRVWVVEDPAVMSGGGFPGREILAYCTRHPETAPMAYVYSVEDLPDQADVIAVFGRNVPDYLSAYSEGRACKAKRLVFISPSVGPDAVPAKLLEESQVVWIAGSLLASRHPAYAESRSWVRFVPGCERYIPKWVEIVAKSAASL